MTILKRLEAIIIHTKENACKYRVNYNGKFSKVLNK